MSSLSITLNNKSNGCGMEALEIARALQKLKQVEHMLTYSHILDIRSLLIHKGTLMTLDILYSII